MQQELKNYSANKQDKLIRSFGRIKSRKLSDRKNLLLEEFLPQYEIALSHSEPNSCPPESHTCHPERSEGSHTSLRDLSSRICKTNSKAQDDSVRILEIGFGFGDFLFNQAKNNPDTLFIGAEPHLNGIVNLLSKLEAEPLKNIRIFKHDIRVLLEKLPDEFFDEIYILFPDPWPKSKHFKRRLINSNFLDFLSKKIKKHGKLTIATDHDSYKTWILSAIVENKNFSWEAESKKNWQNFPSWWIETKYQKKAALEGRQSVIFNLVRK
ncbi:MAG: tRNA (guanosine(46)-N7)-methyltransferase TrmB [Rickettsiales bacterium]|nr:tRNA (guanosine(46)-N7)-methyltransferase TrmB [Rickettsiales bacterium]